MRITIDIDSAKKETLLLTLWKAINLDLDVERVLISPSGMGYHIVLRSKDAKSPIEALMIRALLDDDPYRLRYSLKKLALGVKPDILFDEKRYTNGTIKKAREIEIDLDKLKKLKTPEEVISVAGKLKLPHVKSVWITVFEIPDERKEEILQVLSDIRERDPSFRFKIKPNLYQHGKTESIALIYSPDKDTAHKRGMWLKSKLNLEGYWVKEIKRKEV